MITEDFKTLPTKEKIIRIGAEIIVKEGLKKFTAKNIADRLGITDAAIFKHFKSMDDIILEIINRYVSKCSKSAEEAIKKGKDAKEILEILLREHIKVLEETKGAVPILCFELSRSDDKQFTTILKQFVESYKEKISKIIKEGQEKGCVRPDLDPEDTSLFFIGSIQAKVFAYTILEKEGPIIENPDAFIEQIFYGIIIDNKK
ncbi:MAG: TetR/AcrR family transcriptional regulator [Aquificae bacterium]|nr:TetR/AcrR family transcriptional regulator [Aquificota bacterium]